MKLLANFRGEKRILSSASVPESFRVRYVVSMIDAACVDDT